MYDSYFLSGSSFILLLSAGGSCLRRPYCLQWSSSLDTSGRRTEGGGRPPQHSAATPPLHRSPLSLLTGGNLGMKAAFSLFLHPPVTVYSRMGHASLGSKERRPPNGDQRLLWEMVVSEARSEPRPGLDSPSVTCDTIVTHQQHKCTAGERRKEFHKGGTGGY